jgi:hypothetical protein
VNCPQLTQLSSLRGRVGSGEEGGVRDRDGGALKVLVSLALNICWSKVKGMATPAVVVPSTSSWGGDGRAS